MKQTFGKYRVIRELGKGAMGIVYLAFDPDLQRQVAVKTISATSTIEDPNTRERFVREARSAGRLRHQNIITIYDFGKEEDQLYLAMEFLDGKDLDAIIAEGQRIDIKDKLDMIRQICLGLHYAHENNVFHRDVKPANIKVLGDSTVKIMDFGLAIMQASSITHTGTVLGTPHYMAPETIQGSRADARSDQFAVGAVMYEMLTQKRPFTGESIPALMYNLINNQPNDINPDFKTRFPEIDYIIKTALSKDPELRYNSMKDMADHIDILLTRMREEGFSMTDSLEVIEEPMEHGPPGTQVLPSTAKESHILRQKRKHQRLTFTFAAIAFIAVAAVIYFLFIKKSVEVAGDPGFFILDVKPYAVIDSIVNTGTGKPVKLKEEYKSTPVRITLLPGTYKITYSHPKWNENRTKEFTVTAGQSQVETDSMDKTFIDDAIRHFSLPPGIIRSKRP